LKSADIRNMTASEIEHKLLDLKKQLFELRAELQTGRVERPHRFSAVRRDIARCHTILKEKSSEGQ